MAIVIALMVIIAFWYITRQVTQSAEVKIASALTQGEAMVINKVDMLEKRDNRTTLRVTADKATISDDRKRIRLNGFSVISYGGESGDVTIIAGEGLLTSGSNDVMAEGGALVMDREGRALFSESLRWENDGRVLVSETPVRIFGGNFLLKGAHLEAWLDEGRARLSGGVVAVFSKE